MKVKLLNGRRAQERDIKALEAKLGCTLAVGFRRFVRMNDGAQAEPNGFKTGRSNRECVEAFIPITDIWEERSDIEVLPKRAYPVAHDGMGNYIYIDADRGDAVFFWDHETDKRRKVTKDFEMFVELLEPLDLDSLPPPEGEVEILDPEAFKAATASLPRWDKKK